MDKEELYNLIGQRNPHRRGGNEGPVTRHTLLDKAIASPANVRFGEMVKLVEAVRFGLSRVSGSHHIFVHPDIKELVNIQDVNGMAKPYQVRQFLKLVERYNLVVRGES